MKRLIALALIVAALATMAGIASAEHGNVGGVGTNSNGQIRPLESGNIGGIGAR